MPTASRHASAAGPGRRPPPFRRARRAGLALAALLLLIAAPAPAFAGDRDPCSFAGSIDTRLDSKSGFLGTINAIYQRVHGLFGDAYLAPVPEAERGVHFTRRAGFFHVLDCGETDENRRLIRAGMFGVGDIFMPEKLHFFPVAGEERKYYYGVTRYGLYAYVDAADLIPMGDDKAYFFNEMSEPIQFCTNGDRCSGPSKEFHIRHHFAVADHAVLAPLRADLAARRGCRPVPVSIYRSDDVSRAPQLQYQRASLAFCHRDSWNGIRVRTAAEATAQLSDLSVTGQYFFLLSQPIASRIPFVLSRVPCATRKDVKKKSVFSLGGSLNAGLDYVVKVEGGGKAQIAYELSDTETFESGVQYLYPTYTVFPKQSAGALTARVNDLEIQHACTGKTPQRPRQIFLHVDPATDKAISLDVARLEEKAREFVPTRWEPSTSAKLHGYSWRIFELRQYLLWRNILWQLVANDLTGVFPQGTDVRVRRDAVSFYIAVFMASSFEYISSDEIPAPPPWANGGHTDG